MKHFGYYLFVVFSYTVTLLPWRVLYLVSDLLYVLLYHVVRYRRHVVEKNLRNAFPEKSADELKKIRRRYFRHLSDMFIETLKPIHMSARQIKKHFIVVDTSLTDRFLEEGRDVVLLGSHYNNWEWYSALQLSSRHTVLTIYKPLKNKDFDRYLFRLRSKFGVRLTPMNHILRELVKCRNENIRTISGFVADQTPPADDNAFWTTFLNQETAFYRGAEKVAIKYDMPVIFVNIIKKKRGYYELDYKLITERPREEETNFIMSRYATMLEEIIRSKPEYWLWSHRRWKHKKPVRND